MSHLEYFLHLPLLLPRSGGKYIFGGTEFSFLPHKTLDRNLNRAEVQIYLFPEPHCFLPFRILLLSLALPEHLYIVLVITFGSHTYIHILDVLRLTKARV
jgi:hypothetical protein